jgi:hypothetical protein
MFSRRATLRVNPTPTYRFPVIVPETDSEMMVRIGVKQIMHGETMSVRRMVGGKMRSVRVFYHPSWWVGASRLEMHTGGRIGKGFRITCRTYRADILAEAVGTILPHGQTTTSHYKIILENGQHMDCSAHAARYECLASYCNDWRNLYLPERTCPGNKRINATQNCRYVQFTQFSGRVFVQGLRTNDDEENLVYYGDAWSQEDLLDQVPH